MPGYALTVEQHQALKKILAELSADMEATGLLLSDYGGNILVEAMPSGDDRVETLAALAAGSFVATRELAGLIGEKEFRWVFHMGHKTSIYIQCIASHYLVFAVLGHRTTQGLAKLYVEKASAQLERILLKAEKQTVAATIPSQTFKMDPGADPFKKAR
jgi:predicted regulator of Ras-like GTPase activity (Roadblock/LC7/MglB family)